MLKQNDVNKGPAMLFLKDRVETGRITLKARRVGGNEGFLMFFNAAGRDRYMFCNYGAAGNHFSAIQGTPSDGIAINGGGDRQGPIENDRWYEISLVLTRNSAEMLLDGRRIGKMEATAAARVFRYGRLRPPTAGRRRPRYELPSRRGYHDGPTGPRGKDRSNGRALRQFARIGPTTRIRWRNPCGSSRGSNRLSDAAASSPSEIEPRSVNVLRIPSSRSRQGNKQQWPGRLPHCQIRRVAGGVPEPDQLVVHLGHEHLEAGHLLYGEVLADPRKDRLDAPLRRRRARPDRQ